MKITENQLWFLLDTVAVRESAIGGNILKSDAARGLMERLPKPTPSECKAMHEQGYEVVKS